MYEIFEKLLQSRGVSAYKVSKETGISTATLTSWKKGNYVPKADKLQKIADYFGVDIDYLMGNVSENKNEEQYYLNDDAKDMVQFLFEHPEYKVLFDASRKVKKEDIEFVKQMLDRFKQE